MKITMTNGLTIGMKMTINGLTIGMMNTMTKSGLTIGTKTGIQMNGLMTKILTKKGSTKIWMETILVGPRVLTARVKRTQARARAKARKRP